MRMMTFAKRCAKEILRDPLNLCFGLGFPMVLLYLLSAMQANIPVSLFEINTLAPGITVFGLAFMTLFSATLIAKDRESALLQRLYTTPLTGLDFILGYMISIFPMALAQTILCYIFAIPLGLNVTPNILYAIIGIIPMAIFNIALGLLCGSLLGVKQVGGICGALLTNLSAWLSGVWFDLDLVGGFFKKDPRKDKIMDFALRRFREEFGVDAAEFEALEIVKNSLYPILLSAGSNEKLDTILAEIARNNPKETTVVILPGCNHGNGMYKQTEMYQKAIREFISANSIVR